MGKRGYEEPHEGGNTVGPKGPGGGSERRRRY